MTTQPGTPGPTPTTGSGGEPSSRTPSGGAGLPDDATGVTRTQILVGNIVSRGGILGDMFTGNYYGAAAYFATVNAAGGVNGRSIKLDPCVNDFGDAQSNTTCTAQLVDADHVFATVGNNIYRYAGAQRMSLTGTPDIGGEPIDNAYDRYPHLYSLLGSEGPRDGQPVTVSYATSELEQFFKDRVGVRRAAVVYYDIPVSRNGARLTQKKLMDGGIPAQLYPVAYPPGEDFATTVDQMRTAGIDGVWDALDTAGNVKLCAAVDANPRFLTQLKVKTASIATWDQQVPTVFANAPGCRNKLWAFGKTANYGDPRNDEVVAFRAAMTTYFATRSDRLSQWSLEGWVAAMWFTDAVRSCGEQVTRACVEAFMNRPTPYTAHGLLNGSRFLPYDNSSTETRCPSVAAWSDAAGTWITKNPIAGGACYPTKSYRYDIPS